MSISHSLIMGVGIAYFIFLLIVYLFNPLRWRFIEEFRKTKKIDMRVQEPIDMKKPREHPEGEKKLTIVKELGYALPSAIIPIGIVLSIARGKIPLTPSVLYQITWALIGIVGILGVFLFDKKASPKIARILGWAGVGFFSSVIVTIAMYLPEIIYLYSSDTFYTSTGTLNLTRTTVSNSTDRSLIGMVAFITGFSILWLVIVIFPLSIRTWWNSRKRLFQVEEFIRKYQKSKDKEDKEL